MSEDTASSPKAEKMDREESITNHIHPEESSSNELLLSWRLDPKKNFSDWTIEIVPVDLPKIDKWALLGDDDSSSQDTLQGQVEVYHVNRVVMAFGENKSEHFAALFNENSSDHKGHTRIESSPLGAEYFPYLLDFFYGQFPDEELSVGNVLALRHLADRFGVRKLYKIADDYITNSLLHFENCIKLINQVDKFEDEQLMITVADACARQYSKGRHDHFVSLCPLLFTKVMTSSALKCESGEYSVLLMEHIHPQTRISPSFL